MPFTGKLQGLLLKASALFLLLFLFSPVKADDEDFNIISSRVAQETKAPFIRSLKRLDDDVARGMREQKADGSLPGLDYKDAGRTPYRHLDHLLKMAVAYTTKGSAFHKKRELLTALEKSFDYWHEANPRNSNWWHNEIKVPQLIGRILVILKDGGAEMDADLQQRILSRMATKCGNPDRQTGANKVDVAMHFLYRACVTRDRKLMEYSINQIFMPLTYTMKEGIQHDNSYQQHGPQLYIGGYGHVFLDVVTDIAMKLAGTKYELSGERLDLLSRHVRGIHFEAIRGQYMSFNVLGRGLSRRNSTFQRGFGGILSRMSALDPNHRKEYAEAMLRLGGARPASHALLPVSRHYYRSDYVLHQRPAYTFDIRMVSTRTVRNEHGNGEGVKQYFMSDGATWLSQRGDEFEGIFPAWDWARIPGVTSPHVSQIPLGTVWQHKGTSELVGAASDGLYTVAAYDYRDTYKGVNSSAKKAWFLFDDEIVCLGSGIRSDNGAEVNTTVNQCLLNGKVFISQKGREKSLGKGKYDFDGNLTWLMHDGVAYYFPEEVKAGLECEKRKGSWRELNGGGSGDAVEKDVFTLWIDHGKKPQDAKYSYMILPNKQKVADLRRHPIKDVSILENSSSVQTVYHAGLDILQVVFWEKAGFKSGGIELKAEAPCCIMLRDSKNASRACLYVSDMSRSLDSINLAVKLPSMAGARELTCEFSPEPHEKGMTVPVMLKDAFGKP